MKYDRIYPHFGTINENSPEITPQNPDNIHADTLKLLASENGVNVRQYST